MKQYRPLLAATGLVLATDGIVAWINDAGTWDWSVTWILGTALIAMGLSLRLEKPENTAFMSAAAAIVLQVVIVAVWGRDIGLLSVTGSIWSFLFFVVIVLVLVGVAIFSTFTGRASSEGANFWVAVLASVVLAILINLIADKRLGQRWDLTENRLESLSEQTLTLLGHLETDITVTAFFRDSDPQRGAYGDLLSRYADACARFDYTIIDPDKNPTMAREYNIAPSGNTIAETGEKDLTGALILVTRSVKNTIYVTQWHGEPTFAKGLVSFNQALTDLKYDVRAINLSEEPIPSDAKAVCIIGPKTPFLKGELKLLKDYLAAGGELLAMLDPDTMATGLDELLNPYGITFGHDVIVEPELGLTPYGIQIVGVNTYVRGTKYSRHEIVKDLTEAGMPTAFNAVQTVTWAMSDETVSQEVHNIHGTELVTVGTANSWVEPNVGVLFDEGRQVDPSAKRKGPFTIGYAVTADPTNALADSEDLTRIVVFGDADVANDKQFRWGGNQDLVVNTVNWLTQSIELISIQPRAPGLKPVTLTRDQGAGIFLMSVWRFPAIIFVLGMAFWWWHRRR